MTKALRVISALIGLLAAYFWYRSAIVRFPLAPGGVIGGTLPTDPFNVAMREAANWNFLAAGSTGISVFLLVVAELIAAFKGT